MTTWSRRPAGLVARAAWLGAAMLVIGCGGGGGGRRAVTRLSGAVADIDTRSPVAGAQVTIDGTSRATLTTIRGSFFLDAVDVGRGWRTIRAEKQIGGQNWNGERAVLFDADIPVQTNLLITIAPADRKGTIRGRVMTAGGAAVQNVTVFLNPDTTVAAAYRITDSAGRYEFRDVPAGTYTVVASARELANAANNTVTVTPGATVSVDLSMLVSSTTDIAPPGSLQAAASTYPENAAATQARLRAVQRWLPGGHGIAKVAHRADRFRLQDWPPGSIIEVELSWTPPSATNLAGYVLDRAVGAGSFGTIDRFADPTAIAYDDLDPLYTPDQIYRFRLSAASTSGVQSQPSNTASAQPLAPLRVLSPGNGAAVTGSPAFSWQPVSRAQLYQVLVLSRLPDLTDPTRMPLVWPPANNLTAAQTAATQLTYGGPALQAGSTYFWLVLASDQANLNTAQAISFSQLQAFTAR